MKIGIDARLWSQSGVGRYTRNLVKNLLNVDKSNNYTLFIGSKDFNNLEFTINNLQNLISYGKLKIVKTDIPWHSIQEQLKFPSVISKEKLDLMHFPYFSVPVLYNKPYVITIHDLIINHFPTGKASSLPLPFYFLKRIGYNFVLNNAIYNSKKIIVPSNATQDELIKHFRISDKKIQVIYEGIFDDFSSGSVPHKYRKLGDYFLYVGNAYPHKNLERLIKAYDMFISGIQKNPPSLLLVGRQDYFYSILKNFINKFKNAKEYIIFKDEVDDAELKNLYKNARALIIPSLMEGFGLTALEAMSEGCIVLSSNIPSIHEICKDSCIYFGEQNTLDIKSKLNLVYNSKANTLNILKEKGFRRSRDFSWNKMSVETLKIYESCSGL